MKLKSIDDFQVYEFLQYLPAILSGFMLSLCFPDPGYSWLAFIALVPFFVGLYSMSCRQAFYSGLIMGTVHYLLLLYWIAPTICNFGNLSFASSFSALLLLVIYLALYQGVFALVFRALNPGHITAIIAGSCIWTLLELVRSYILTGFPWGVLGYSQYKQIQILQLADLFGVIGISFFIVWVNLFFSRIWLWIGGERQVTGFFGWKGFTALTATLIFCMSVWSYGQYRIVQINNIISQSPHIMLSVIQGNISENQKWDMGMIPHAIDIYGKLSLKAAKSQPDLIIWPETAMPFFYGQEQFYSQVVDKYIRDSKTSFLVGTLHLAPGDNIATTLRNRAIMVDLNGFSTGYYDKHHLVPFGEYIPFTPLLGHFGKLFAKAGNFSPGRLEFKPLTFQLSRNEPYGPKSCSTGVLICFEILFPHISRQFVLNNADILTTITNDAWFGKTSAPAQHFSLGVLRAVENRRSVARAANTGISGFINPKGEIIERTKIYEEAFLTKPVPLIKEFTIYTKHPFVLPIASSLALLAICVIKIRAKRRPVVIEKKENL